MMRNLLAAACGLSLFMLPASAEDKSPVELKLELKKESIAWPYELGPKEFDAKLREDIKNKVDKLPKPPAIEGVLKFTNTGKEAVTIHIEGDVNTLTFELKGPGTITAQGQKFFTREFRGAKAIELDPGKSTEVVVKSLADGFRKASRYVYPTAPGEFTLSVSYQLANTKGEKGLVLKSNEVKLKVEEPK